MAQPLQYSNDVPVAVTLEEYVAWLTGQGPKPSAGDSFWRSLYSKSIVWDYESEWRVIDKNQEPEADIYSDWRFHLEELVAVILDAAYERSPGRKLSNNFPTGLRQSPCSRCTTSPFVSN